jgi:HTH-type transcriptional regulator, sugar sensing transcriptional regulator
LTEETVKNMLKEIGLTDKETEVYIFLSRYGALKGLELTKRIKKHKGQTYNILKSLQSKGLVQPTLEFPARFAAVPLETAIDLNIKAKREAAALIESKRADMLNYWRTIKQAEDPTLIEKFTVMEGNRQIYPKIAQMIKETKNQLSVISNLQGLLRADQHDVFDAVLERTLESHFECCVIAEFSAQNVTVLKKLLENLPVGLNFKGRSPNLGQQLTPRMIIRDNEEILFFISSEKENADNENNSCLWTNCKALVQSFGAVFSNLWENSLDIEKKIHSIEVGKPSTHTIFDGQIVLKKYEEVFRSAKDEVIIVTSSEEFRNLVKKSTTLKGLSQKGVSIKVMAPITRENSEVSKSLSRYCEIKHYPVSQLRTTLVDGQHVFQFNDKQLHLDPQQETPFLNTAIYTNDYEQAKNIKKMLHNIWKNAQVQLEVSKPFTDIMSEVAVCSLWEKLGQNPQRKSLLQLREKKVGELTDKEILDKMIHAKRLPAKDPMKDKNIQYGSKAIAVIYSPNEFKLPDMTISVRHDNKQSSFGAEDSLSISLWLETPKGCAFVPVVLVTDNPKAAEWRKGVYAGTPAEKNSMLVRKNQLKITVQGNTLFAGWTIPIPLLPPKFVLPPASILFEGYGELKTAVIRTSLPSGRTQVNECNRFEAFVTFFHPASTYQGPGTDGAFYREYVMTAYPPSSGKQ